MIYCLTGQIVKKALDSVVLSCAGVGYLAQVPQSTAGRLPAVGEIATLYTVLNVTDNDIALYGFETEEQQSCFKLLTAVSGVGPKAGLAVLSVMSPEQVALAASAGDHKAFTRASGVGPKLAQLFSLEPAAKVGKGLAGGEGFAVGDGPAPAASSAPAQAVAALVALGYNASDAARAVSRVDDTLSVQDMIKIALRGLSKL